MVHSGYDFAPHARALRIGKLNLAQPTGPGNARPVFRASPVPLLIRSDAQVRLRSKLASGIETEVSENL